MDVMIVEDDQITRRLLEKVIAEMGHVAVSAANGRIAWERFQAKPVRVIVTDWMMPEMDGLALCRRLRASRKEQYVYILVLTSRANKADLLEVFEAGADDFIAKPFDKEELKARIKTAERIVDLENRHRGMQETLIESRNKVRVVFDSLQEKIVSIDANMTLVSANKQFQRDQGGTYGDIIGKRVSDTGGDGPNPVLKTEVIQRIQSAFADRQPQYFLDSYTDDHGEQCHHQISCLPVVGKDGAADQVVVVSKDISEDRRKAEEIKLLHKHVSESAEQLAAKNSALEETLAHLEATQTQIIQQEKMASIGQLAAGVAHEIKNPTGFVDSNLVSLVDYLSKIDHFLTGYRQVADQLLPETPQMQLPDNVRDLVEKLHTEAQAVDLDFIREDIQELIQDCREGTRRIKKIVLDLKSFAHPGEAQLQFADINKGLQSTLNVVKTEIKYKAEVLTDFGDIPLVECFAQELNQVFMNLLVNAAQAMQTRGQIKVSTRRLESQVRIEISDTGAGIAPEHIDKIFDPFFTTKGVGKGTGLGMHIAYNIVRKHNGTIQVESTPGEGTTFTIDLPVQADMDATPAQTG